MGAVREMLRVRPHPRPLLLVCLALLLGACGDGTPPPATGGAPIDPAALLAGLEGRVRSGDGISDASWTREVQEVGLALWPDRPEAIDATAQAARQAHTHLAHIAGDMAGQLRAGGETARADWLVSDPLSVEVHDGFLEAARGGPDAYRLWVEGAGAEILRRRVEALGGR